MATTVQEKVFGYLPGDQPPFGQMILLGLQHVITMFPATVLCALLMGFSVSTVLAVTGFGTVVALVASRLSIGKFIPLYYGASFSYIAAVVAITKAQYGVEAPPEVIRVVQAGFMVHWVLPERYAGKVMNIHPALLPAFGGKGLYGHFVHEAVLARGCKVTGCTVHFVNNVYDDGPIILQQTCPVEEGDTPDALADRVQAEERVAYPEAIRLFAEGRLRVDGRWVRILPKAK